MINRVAVLGGNGFVGQHVLALLLQRGYAPVCISRSGRPDYLHGETFAWADQVDWKTADGTKLVADDLSDCQALICLVGVPPIPTLTPAFRKQQRALNGEANVNAIDAAKQAGIKRLALLGAHLPCLARSRYFGYFLGKRDASRAANAFAEQQDAHATIVRPGFIIGKRYLKSGKAVRLDRYLGFLAPISFSYIVSVEQVALALVNAIEKAPEALAIDENKSLTILDKDFLKLLTRQQNRSS